MTLLNKNSTKVLYKALANPFRAEAHHETTYERWIVGSLYEGRKVIQLAYDRASKELYVLLEDGEEIEINNIARLYYKPINDLDAVTRNVYIRQEDIQESETSEQE